MYLWRSVLKLTHNDYYTTIGTGPEWKVQLQPCSKKIIEDYHKELRNAARIIYDSVSSPITLLYSGGLDSEFMLQIFLKEKIPFKTAIISYGDYNAHDTEYAFDFCESHGIIPIMVDIDIDDFIKSGRIYDIANSVNCCAYQMPSIMAGLEKLDGTVIMANGEPYLKNIDNIWKYEETERVNSYMHWYRQNSIDGTPDFLRYTPEATLAFLREPRVQELILNKHPGKLSTRTSKHMIYSKNYLFRPRPKFTGWEKIEKQDYFREVYDMFSELRKKHNGVFTLDSHQLIQILAKG